MTARHVSLGYGAWARLLLCDEHGHRYPVYGTNPFRVANS